MSKVAGQEIYRMRSTILSVLIILSVGVTACSDRKAGPAEEKKAVPSPSMTVHGARGQSKPQNISEILKQKTLPDFPSATIGKAFDSYGFFKKKEWRESRSGGKIYLDFIGTLDAKILEVLKTNVTLQSVIFKFVILDDNQFGLVMVSVDNLMKDGTIQTFAITDIKGILARIYANEEIKVQLDK